VTAYQFARGYILNMIDTILFQDYSMNMVQVKWLPLLEDFDARSAMSWDSVVLAFLDMELYKVAMM